MRPLSRALAAASAAAALSLGAFGAAPASAQDGPPCQHVPGCVDFAFETARWAQTTAEAAANEANEAIDDAIELLLHPECLDAGCLPNKYELCEDVYWVLGIEPDECPLLRR